MDHTGPIPAELLRDPSVVYAAPWGFQAGETKRVQIRERLVWITAVAVSWGVTAIAVLRILNVF